MKSFLILVFAIVLQSSLYAQTEEKKDSTKHLSYLIQDYRIEKLNTVYENTYELTGYRIQIYSGSKRQPARQARLKFTQKFKNISAHEKYDQPNYKVRVGDFKTKLEALKFQKEIMSFFPDCYIVNDKIEFEKKE